jgi:hypothetical protein
MPSEGGQLTGTCKGTTYLQIESRRTVLVTIILQYLKMNLQSSVVLMLNMNGALCTL